MKHENSFSVSRFKNRNGVFSFRVKGHLNGVRIRRNFKTKEEASAERALLEITAAQIESGRPNQLVTSLTLEQVRDAEAALRRLGAASHSLSFCTDFTLANYRKPDHEMPLADALKEYVAANRRFEVQAGGRRAFCVSPRPASPDCSSTPVLKFRVADQPVCLVPGPARSTLSKEGLNHENCQVLGRFNSLGRGQPLVSGLCHGHAGGQQRRDDAAELSQRKPGADVHVLHERRDPFLRQPHLG